MDDGYAFLIDMLVFNVIMLQKYFKLWCEIKIEIVSILIQNHHWPSNQIKRGIEIPIIEHFIHESTVLYPVS